VHLKISWKYVVAFFALNNVISELHEQSHIQANWLINACYGPRDFNLVNACAGMPNLALMAAFAGPMFSYLVMWAGVAVLMRAAGSAGRSIGFTLVFAPLPFARIFTALVGGGDERGVVARLLEGVATLPQARWLAVAMTLAFCAPPIWIAWRDLANKHRTWLVAGFCVVPLLVIYAYKFTLLNGLLARGVLAEPVYFGTPAFVQVFFALTLVLVLVGWPWLRRLESTGGAKAVAAQPVAL
jgi:hypothetical protein